MSDMAKSLAFAKVVGGGGGSGPTLETLNVNANGEYTPSSGRAWNKVVASVPNSYSAGDEGKVVSNGALVPQTSSSVTENGTVDTTLINSVNVNVSGGGGSDAEDAIIMRTISGLYENGRVTSIGSAGFQYCSNLTAASFPEVTSMGPYVFQYCGKLTTALFPKVTSISPFAFQNCSLLTVTSFEAVTTISNNAFAFCSSITTISFPKVKSIEASVFSKNLILISLYLTGSSVAKLANSNAFTSTPIGGYSASAGQYGSIYVPSSLLSSYKASTNWTYFSNRFVGV